MSETQMVMAVATRQGSRAYNADGAATVHLARAGVSAAAVVDGIGNSAEVAELTHIAAEVAARVGARRGALAGLMAAAELVAPPAAGLVGPDGVAVLAVAVPGEETGVAWVGDCRAYGWDGTVLRQYTTDQTVGEQLKRNGVALELAEQHDNWIRTSLGHAVVGTVYQVKIPEDVPVLLTSDGVHDSVPHGELEALVREHIGDPQALADAIVAAAREDGEGYRDDATVIVMACGS